MFLAFLVVNDSSVNGYKEASPLRKAYASGAIDRDQKGYSEKPPLAEVARYFSVCPLNFPFLHSPARVVCTRLAVNNKGGRDAVKRG